MLLDPVTTGYVATAAMGAAVVGAVGGFGTGVVLTAVLVPLIGFKAVVPVMAIAGVLINGGRYWFYRDSTDWKAVGRVLAGSLPMLVLGVWLYSLLEARVIGLVLGGFVIASVPLRRWAKRQSLRVGPAGLVAGAGVFGLASGVATGTGVILVSLLLGAGYAGTAVLAIDAMASILVDIAKALLFGKFDLLDAPSATLGVIIGIATFPGSALGAWLVKRMGATMHVLAMEALILVGGGSLLWHALAGKS